MKRCHLICSLLAILFLSSAGLQQTSADWYDPIVIQFQQEGFLDATKPFEAGKEATRAEFVWLTVQLLGGFSNTNPQKQTFDDVVPENSYYPAFEKAVTQGWLTGARGCAGTHPCFAKPWDTINRAEAAAMISKAFRLRTTSFHARIPDVREDTWYAAPMQTLAAYCILKGDTQSGLFRPEYTLNRAEMIAMLDRARSTGREPACSESPPASPPISSESSSSSESSVSSESQLDLPELSLELTSVQTVGDKIPRGTQGLSTLRFKATASCKRNITIDAITIAQGGQGYISDIVGVWLRGDGQRLSRSQPLSHSDGTAYVRLFESFVLEACSSRTIEVMADFAHNALSNARHRFFVEFETDVETDAKTIGGAFPFESDTFQLSTQQTGVISIEYLPLEEIIEEELMNAVIGRFSLTIDDHEDQIVYWLQMLNTGTAQDGDFANMYIRGFGTRLSDYEPQTVDDHVTFRFVPPEPFEKDDAGEEYIFEVMADIVSGKRKDIRMQLKEPSDLFAAGSKYGHGLNGQLYGSYVDVKGRAQRIRIYQSSVIEDPISY